MRYLTIALLTTLALGLSGCSDSFGPSDQTNPVPLQGISTSPRTQPKALMGISTVPGLPPGRISKPSN